MYNIWRVKFVPRLPADVRIGLKKRGRATPRIELDGGLPPWRYLVLQHAVSKRESQRKTPTGGCRGPEPLWLGPDGLLFQAAEDVAGNGDVGRALPIRMKNLRFHGSRSLAQERQTTYILDYRDGDWDESCASPLGSVPRW